jgi:hypothetical protein
MLTRPPLSLIVALAAHLRGLAGRLNVDCSTKCSVTSALMNSGIGYVASG